MRRVVTGVFRSISVKHPGRYTGDATIRLNRKADSCLETPMARMICNGEGRLLAYAMPF